MKNKLNKKIENIPDGWRRCSLGNLFEFKNGVNAEKGAYGKGIKFINLMDVFKRNFIVSDDIQGKVSLSKKVIDENLIIKGDIVFNRTSETLAEIGMTSVYLDSERVVFGGFVIRGRARNKELLDSYKKYCFFATSVRREIIRRGQGAVRANIGQKDLNKVLISFPNIDEQKRIVVILEMWDEYLEKLERKIEIKKNIKKGLMQQLLTGKKRLKGFSAEWREFTLNEIGSVRTSSVDKLTRDGEQSVGLLNYMDVYRRDVVTSGDMFQQVTAKQSQIVSSNLRRGDVLFTPSSETQIDIGHSAVVVVDLVAVVFSYHLIRFRPKSKTLYPEYSAYCFKGYSFYKELWKKSQGATRYTLSKDAIEKSKITIPICKDEQKAIAGILINIDNEIEALEKKRNVIAAQKKYFLNKLITGGIRTPEDLLEKVKNG